MLQETTRDRSASGDVDGPTGGCYLFSLPERSREAGREEVMDHENDYEFFAAIAVVALMIALVAWLT